MGDTGTYATRVPRDKRCMHHIETESEKTQVEFEMEGVSIATEVMVKYLGVTIDQGPTFGRHITAVARESKQDGACAWGPFTKCKRPQTKQKENALHGCGILYAAPIWYEAVARTPTNVNILKKTQRHMRICSAYRTVSNEALVVVAGVILLHRAARERYLLSRKHRQMKMPQHAERKQLQSGRRSGTAR